MMIKFSLSTALVVAASSTRCLAFVAAPRHGRAAAATGHRLPSIRSGSSHLFLLDKLFSTNPAQSSKYPIYADEKVMSQKAHGTSEKPVQKNLRWNCDYSTADRICNFNRHYAEYAGYWQTTDFLNAVKEEELPIKFYDSVTGVLMFTAPVGRTMKDFLMESQKHGWPSFRDEECNWDHVRCLKNGECISTTGTHLGHNLPDSTGNRYCINLVSVAGRPEEE